MPQAEYKAWIRLVVAKYLQLRLFLFDLQRLVGAKDPSVENIVRKSSTIANFACFAISCQRLFLVFRN